MKKIKSFLIRMIALFAIFAFNVIDSLAPVLRIVPNRKERRGSPIARYNRMLKRADNEQYESFEGQDIHNIEDYENLVAQGVPIRFQPKVVQGRRGVMALPGNVKASSLVAQFDLQITRIQTGVAPIATNFDIHIFNPLNLWNDYNKLITVPVGVTLTSITRVGNDLVYLFTQGANTETVTIHGVTSEYYSFLLGLRNAEFTINKIRLQNVANFSLYFSTKIQTAKKSLFGKLSDLDSIPFTSQKSPMQVQNGILDLDVLINIQNDKGLTYEMPQVYNDALNLSFNINSFILK